MFFEKRAFEQDFAARSAAVAFAATEFEGGESLLFVEIDLNEAAHFALRLAGAKLGVFDGARAKARGAYVCGGDGA